MRSTRLTALLTVVAGLIFIAASLPKIANPHTFAKNVYQYQLSPVAAINIIAIYLPWLELICGTAILLSILYRKAALITAAALLAVFTVAIGINVCRGLNIACGCFSADEEGMRIGWMKIGENIAFFTVLCLLATIKKDRYFTLDYRRNIS
jgi:uncharacterized membrane protein YphA (DoxX/SURF4 family)